MGGAHSRDGYLDSSDEENEENEETNYEDASEGNSSERIKTPSSIDDVDAKLKALKLKYSS
ncbi:protein CYPRO4-like, partial [Trifolium medium]|nr:protein CYPRO4-like [Trifolium medium]